MQARGLDVQDPRLALFSQDSGASGLYFYLRSSFFLSVFSRLASFLLWLSLFSENMLLHLLWIYSTILLQQPITASNWLNFSGPIPISTETSRD